MEKGLSRKGKRLILPLLALVGILGIGATHSPNYEEAAAADSSTTATTYTIYRHKIVQSEYKKTISKLSFDSRGESPTELNLGGKKWQVAVKTSHNWALDYEQHYSRQNYEKGDSYGRGLKFGTSENPVDSITFTLPATQFGDGTVVQSLMVNSAAWTYDNDGTNEVKLTMKVGDTTFGGVAQSMESFYDREYTASGNPTSGDVTFTWDQSSASKKVPIFIWYFEVRYATTDNNHALHYADTFMSSTCVTCLDDGDTVQDELKTTWATLATQYKALAATDQSTVRNALTTDETALGHMAERYDYIYGKYGISLGLENFLERKTVSNTLYVPSDNGEHDEAIIKGLAIGGALIALSAVILLRRKRATKRR